MKTCKDCIYFYKHDEVGFDQCRLYPDPIQTVSSYWCGQLKEKAQPETFYNDYSATLSRFDDIMSKGKPMEWDVPLGTHKLTIERSGSQIHFLFERHEL